MYILDGRKLVVAALARHLRGLGYKWTTGHIHRVLSGERVPGPELMTALCRVFGRSKEGTQRMLEDTARAYKEWGKIPDYEMRVTER